MKKSNFDYKIGFYILLGMGIMAMLGSTAKKMSSIGINDDNSDPHPSAMLDVKSSKKGAVFPRMTQAQRDAINNPVQGLLVYQTDGELGYYYYENTAWVQIPSIDDTRPALVTEAQRNAMTSPVQGLQVYQTDNTKGHYYHDGSAWVQIPSIDDTRPALVTEAQRNAMTSPVQGLQVYQTDNTKGHYYHDGSAWVQIPSMDDTKPALVTEAQRNAMTSPVQGLQVYQTDNIKGHYYYDGTAWIRVPSMDDTTPTGTIVAFGGDVSSPPIGWAVCNGAAESRTSPQYKDLFAAIGTAWGTGDGSTTFNLPDLRGMFLRGVNASRTDTYADPNRATRTALNSGNAGDNVGSFQGHQFKEHNHSVNISGTTATDGAHTHGLSGVQNNGRGSSGSDFDVLELNSSATTTNTGSEHSHSFTVSGNTDNAGGDETRPNNAYVYYIIKL